MSEELTAPPGDVFHEIKTGPPERTYRFRPLRPLTYLVTGLLIVNGVVLLMRVFGLVAQQGLLSRIARHGFASQAAMMTAANASDNFIRLVAVLVLLTLVSAYIAAAVWIFRAAANVRALGTKGLDTSPGWSVGWYFVPILGWFRPYQAMSQIYQASVSPMRWRRERPPALLPVWWAVWILMGLSGNVLGFLSRSHPDLPTMLTLGNLQIGEALVDLIGLALFGVVVWQVSHAQMASRLRETDVASVFT